MDGTWTPYEWPLMYQIYFLSWKIQLSRMLHGCLNLVNGFIKSNIVLENVNIFHFNFNLQYLSRLFVFIIDMHPLEIT